MADSQKADIASSAFEAGSAHEAKVGAGKGLLAPQGPRAMGSAARHGRENFCGRPSAGQRGCPSQVPMNAAAFDYSDHLPFVLRDAPAFPSWLTSVAVPPVAPPSPQRVEPPPRLERPAVPVPWDGLLTGLRAEPMKVTMSDSHASAPRSRPADWSPAPEQPSRPSAEQQAAPGKRRGQPPPSQLAAEQQQQPSQPPPHRRPPRLPQQQLPQQQQEPAGRSDVKQSTLVLAYFPRQASDAEICQALDEATGHPGCVRRARVVREGGLYGVFEFAGRDLAAAVLRACEDGKIVIRDQTNNKKWFMHASRSKRVTVDSFNADHRSEAPRRERGCYRSSRGD